MFLFESTPKNVRICVIGDVMLDHYILGTCERISPEAPIQIVDVKNESYTLGGAGNVLKNLQALGAQSSFISLCGDDDESLIVNEKLNDAGLAYMHLERDPTRRTTVKSRVSVNRHQLIRLDKEDRHVCSQTVADNILEKFKAIAKNIDLLVISDYCKGAVNDYLASQLIKTCLQFNITCIVDTKNKDLAKYKGASIIKPNKKEASLASGITIIDDNSLINACQIISNATSCKAIVVTLSEDGIAIYQNNQLEKIPTKAIEVFDVTGAGDTVIAALAFAIAHGVSITQACNFANHAAAVVVAKFGSATATIAEIKQLVTNK